MSTAAVLPADLERTLAELVRAACDCFQDDLASVTLFGSAAEGRLRPSSDVNLLFVLKRFAKERIDAFRDPLRVAHLTVHAAAMFVLDSELESAAEAFAVKFADLGRRRRVLFGADPIARLSVSREAQKSRLRQILLNLTLRLRERYAMTSLREEYLALVIAEAAGPLRAAAATLLDLEGLSAASPKEALQNVAQALGNPAVIAALERVSQARETGQLPAGVASPTLFGLFALLEALQQRTARLA